MQKDFKNTFSVLLGLQRKIIFVNSVTSLKKSNNISHYVLCNAMSILFKFVKMSFVFLKRLPSSSSCIVNKVSVNYI